MPEEQKKQLIISPGSFMEAYWNLTSAERRLVLLIAQMTQKNDDALKSYKFSSKDFDTAETKGQDIRKLIVKMLEKVLVIREPPYKYLYINWITLAEYSEREGYELCIAPKLKPYLLQLKKQLDHYQSAIRLENFYSIRLYELLILHDPLEKKQFDLKRLRQIFTLKDSKYRLYGDFKKRILIPSQKEICEKTDIVFDFKEIKEKRSVNAILFDIRSAIQSETQDDTPDELLNLVPEGCRDDMGIIAKVFANCDRHGAAYVRRNIEYANQHCPTNNYGMFLEKALREDLGKG